MADLLRLNTNHRNPVLADLGVELAPAEQLSREEARWRILRVLQTGHPIPVSELLLQQVLHDRDYPVSIGDLRKELSFLQKKGVVKVLSTAIWVVEPTPYGLDIAQYAVDCPPGITRPAKI